jgi:hypothetical protein
MSIIIDLGFFIRALQSLPDEADRIRLYQEVLCSYHRDCRARIAAQAQAAARPREFPTIVQIQLRSLVRKVAEARRQKQSFQARADRLTKRFEEARAEVATRPKEFPTIIQIQLQSVTQTFEEVAELAHINKKRKLCNEL